MNIETTPDLHALHTIQRTIAAKAWYGLTESGMFNWPASVGKMTESLRSDLSWNAPGLFETVREALESAFTPDCLTRVGQEPFVARLAELAETHGNSLIVWTVGDVGWQRNKADRTGIFALGVTEENFHCCAENKREGLLNILKRIREHTPGKEMVHTYVLDDKESSIQDIRSLGEEAAALNIVLHDFIVKLGVHGATPADAYAYLRQQSARMGHNAVFVSDYDGVIADTDGALKIRGARNLYNAYIKSATP